MRAESSATRPTQASADTASLPGGDDHLGLVAAMATNLFLLFALRHLDMVKGGSDLSSDLVELLGGDMSMAVSLVFAGASKSPTADWQSQGVRMN